MFVLFARDKPTNSACLSDFNLSIQSESNPQCSSLEPFLGELAFNGLRALVFLRAAP